MKLIALPRFTRMLKKLHPDEKRALDEGVRAITADPEIGKMKKADLAGVQVYKYRCHSRLLLVAYGAAQDEAAIKLLAIASHENFYRDLKHR